MRILSATSNELLFGMYFEKVLNLNLICECLAFCRILVLFNRWPKTSVSSFNKRSTGKQEIMCQEYRLSLTKHEEIGKRGEKVFLNKRFTKRFDQNIKDH